MRWRKRLWWRSQLWGDTISRDTVDVLLLGAFGYGNLGDEWCLAEAISHAGSARVGVVTRSVRRSRQALTGLRFVEDQSIAWLGHADDLSRTGAECVIIGGGGLGVGTGFRDLVRAAASLRTRVQIHNVELLPSALTKEFITDPDCRRVLRHCDEFSLRDGASLKLGRALVGHVTVTLSGLPESRLEIPLGEVAVKECKRVLWAVSNHRSARETLARENVALQEVARSHVSDFSLSSSAVLAAVNHIWEPDENDVWGGMGAVQVALGGGSHQVGEGVPVYAPSSLIELRRWIAAAELIISDRKHVLLHAAVCGTPAIAVERSGERRIQAFVAAIEQLGLRRSTFVLI